MENASKKIGITVAVIVGLYVGILLVHLPVALAGSGWVSRTAVGVYSILYRPLLSALDEDNWLKIQWQDYSAFWCNKYPEGCSGKGAG